MYWLQVSFKQKCYVLHNSPILTAPARLVLRGCMVQLGKMCRRGSGKCATEKKVHHPFGILYTWGCYIGIVYTKCITNCLAKIIGKIVCVLPFD